MRKMRQSGVDWIGEIPANWRVGRLKHCLSMLESGGTPKSDDDDFYTDEGGVPWVSIADMSSCDCVVDTKKHLTPAGIADKDLKVYPAGTTLYSIYATIGKVAVLGRPAAINQAILALSFERNSCSQYYRYLLKAYEPFATSFTTENTQKNLNAQKVRNIGVTLPPLCDQEGIAKFLDERCSEINSIMVQTKASIEDYKVMKKNLVFDAVTGKNLKGKKVASGQDWLGEIPAAWDVRRIVNLYREVSERGDDSLPILSVSINTGVSDKELSDEEQERVFIRSEDKTKYKRVQPGDLTYNMMRAWQGAFGAVRVNGMVSPAYVVARPKVEMDSRYVEYLLRSPNATREMQRYSRGIADFRLRLYWPEFKNIRIPCPPLEEQKRIADMLDEKCGEIDAIIADKERLISDLEAYKKSLIFEVVTGKREVA